MGYVLENAQFPKETLKLLYSFPIGPPGKMQYSQFSTHTREEDDKNAIRTQFNSNRAHLE